MEKLSCMARMSQVPQSRLEKLLRAALGHICRFSPAPRCSSFLFHWHRNEALLSSQPEMHGIETGCRERTQQAAHRP